MQQGAPGPGIKTPAEKETRTRRNNEIRNEWRANPVRDRIGEDDYYFRGWYEAAPYQTQEKQYHIRSESILETAIFESIHILMSLIRTSAQMP
jgi:hypothetical protein